MNFFDQQDAAKGRTRKLLALFAVAIFLIACSTYAVFVLLSSLYLKDAGGTTDWTQPGLFVASLAGVIAVVGFATFVKVKSLGEGGSDIALSVGGSRITPGTHDPYERQLLNVVEEMAIASGVPVPSVFVLNNENGINAFAAGHAIGDAAVAVTKGALHVLNRSELQAVIAHEFSHILNGDMRLNVRLIGVLYGLMMIGSTGGWMFRSSLYLTAERNRSRVVPATAALGGALWVIGSMGVFAGRLIQRAVSRQREFLADASAVQFTRNPSAMASALAKIGGYASGASVGARGASEISHLFFGEATTSGISGFLATHPSLEDRIRRLDPSFNGTFPTVLMPASLVTTVEPSPAYVGLGATTIPLAMSLPGPAATMSYDPAAFADTVGTVTPEHLEFSVGLIGDIPAEFREAAQSSLGSIALVYTLLLDSDPALARVQMNLLAANSRPEILSEVQTLAALRGALTPHSRLPMIELAVSGLRQLSAQQYAEFKNEIALMVGADGKLNLFEFAVQKSLLHWLDAAFGRVTHQPVQYYAVRALADPISIVLSALAYVGHDSPGNAMHAFQHGVRAIRLLQSNDTEFRSPAQCQFDALDRALTLIAGAAPAIKEQVLDACAAVVFCDHDVTVAEAELLRVIADAIGCPTPPFLPTAAKVLSASAVENAAHAG